MRYNEKPQDLFKMDSKYYLVYCISGDYALGARIATIFNNKYDLRRIIIKKSL